MAKHEDVLLARQESVTFAALIALIEADSGLSPTEKRDYISAIRRFTRYLDIDAENARAGIKAYRAAFEKFVPATAGISKKTWSNILSYVRTVLARYGVSDRRRPCPADLMPAWTELRERAKSTHIRFVRGLSRVMHFCSASGIAPEAVTDAVVADMHRHIIEQSFQRKPNDVYRDTCRLWNRARVEIPGWPDIQLTVPRFDNNFSLPFSAFPASFQEEIERWEKVVSGQDLFAVRAPAKPLRPRTLHHRKEQIRRSASALFRSGVPIEEITSMSVLFDPANFRAVLQYHLDHRGGVLPGLDELASGMTLIGKNWAGIAGDQLAEIRDLARRVRCRKRGMTDKNMAILRQFDDEFNVTTLVQLPDVLVAKAKKQRNPNKAALLVQSALMIQIELSTVIRLDNLRNLRFDQHFDYTRAGRRGVVHMVIPDYTVKNGEPLEFELSRHTVRMLDFYRRTHLPRLAPGGTPYLFPGQKGGAKHPSTVEVQITRTLRDRAGLRMTVHAFRHVAAYLYLKEHPGEYAFVSRLLGHKSIQTTIDFYCGFEAKFAALHYDATILEPRRGPAGRRRR